MADLPDFDNESFIFVGEVTAIDQPTQVHGKLLQDVTYAKVELIMGLKSSLRNPMTVPHDVPRNSSALPKDIFKIGNTLVVGTQEVPEYVHQADQATLQAIHKGLAALVEKLVVKYLKDRNLVVMDENQAFLDGQLLSLDVIVDMTWAALRDKVGDASEGSIDNVRYYVRKYCNDKDTPKFPADWGMTIQVGQAPQIPFWASQRQPPGTLGSLQQGQQITVGLQSRTLGWVHTFQVSSSFFDNQHGAPIFSNALASYQFSYARMLGNPIYSSGPAENWAYLVGTVFAQGGLGIANNSANPNSWNHIHLGLMPVQAQGGAQLGLSIWKITIIAQGAVVYSWVGGQGHSIGAAGFGGLQYGF